MQENISQMQSQHRKTAEAIPGLSAFRFQNFYTMQPQIALFAAPLSSAVIEQPQELQLELCELHSDPFFQTRPVRGEFHFGNFYPSPAFHSSGILPSQWPACLGTYICKSSFSTMKHI